MKVRLLESPPESSSFRSHSRESSNEAFSSGASSGEIENDVCSNTLRSSNSFSIRYGDTDKSNIDTQVFCSSPLTLSTANLTMSRTTSTFGGLMDTTPPMHKSINLSRSTSSAGSSSSSSGGSSTRRGSSSVFSVLFGVLPLVSLSAGFGLWRFPRLVHDNGGGSFLVVYVAMSVIFGLPLIFLEMALGQFTRQGAVKVWRAVPLLKGVGFIQLLGSGLVSIYYAVMMTISLFYLLWSAKGQIPFAECELIDQNITVNWTTGEECLENLIFTGVPQDFKTFCLLLILLFAVWALLFLGLCHGFLSYKIASVVSMLALLSGLVALLTSSLLNNPQAEIALQEMLTFDLSNFMHYELWYGAAIQLFFSTHLGLGNLVTNAGQVNSKNSVYRTAVAFVVLNLLIGMLLVALSAIWFGFIAEAGLEVSLMHHPEMFSIVLIYDTASNVKDSNIGVWASVAFLVVICMLYNSTAATLETLIMAFSSEPKKRAEYSWRIALLACILGFCAGVVFFIPEGKELIHVIEHYTLGRLMLFSVVCELVAFIWIYGHKHLYNDFEFMLGSQLNPIWKIIWILTPVLLVGLEIGSLVLLPYNGLPGSNDPLWATCLGWSLYLVAWVIVLVTAIWQVALQIDYDIKAKFLQTLKPSRMWGPPDPIEQHTWLRWKTELSLTGRRDFTLKRRYTRDYTNTAKVHLSGAASGLNLVPAPHERTM